MKCKLEFAILLAVVMIMVCGCKEEKLVHNYEKPIENLLTSAEHSDTDSYLNCFTPQAKDAYLESEEYDEDLAENVLDGGKLYDADFETRSSVQLSEDELAEIEESYKSKYKKSITIKKGERIEVDFSAVKEEENYSVSRELVVVRIDDSWFIYGDVIDGLDFKLSKKE